MHRKYIIFFSLFFILGAGTKTLGQIREKATLSQKKQQLDSLSKEIEDAFFSSDYVLVIDNAPFAITLSEDIENEEEFFKIKSILGNTFLKLNDTIQARGIFSEMTRKAQFTKNISRETSTYIDLGNTYVDSDPELAIKYFKKVIPYSKKTEDIPRLFVAHFNLAEVYLNQKEKANAKYHIDNALNYAVQSEVEIYTSSVHMLLGRFYLEENNIEEAIRYFEISNQQAEDLNFKDLILENYKYHLKALKQKKDYKAIFELGQLYEPLREEKYESDRISELEIAKAKYNTDKYRQTIKTNELEKRLVNEKAAESRAFNYLAIVTVILLVITLIMFFINARRRKRLLVNLRDKNHQYLIAKEKSDQLAQAKTNFFSTVSHELRTPLYGIIGLSSSLLEDNKEQSLHQDIKSLKFSADYLLALINDVLQLNKLEEKQGQAIESDPFEIRALIKNIVKSFDFMLEQNNNEIIINIASNIPNFIMGDATKISQILINLIGNACKFTEDGIITVSIDQESNSHKNISLKFKVSDTGIGIAKDKQKRIFDEFTTVSSENKYQGTGLGLSIVKKLLDIHKATMDFHSDLGKGTVFSFIISFNKIDENEIQGQSSLIDYNKILEGKHVLVVDDNRINQVVTRKIIENNKMTLETASNDGTEEHL